MTSSSTNKTKVLRLLDSGFFLPVVYFGTCRYSSSFAFLPIVACRFLVTQSLPACIMTSLLDQSRKSLETKLAEVDMPPSTCGLIGVYGVCEALNVSYEISPTHLRFINRRAHHAHVGAYLVSRSCAGMTAETLAEAADEISYRSLHSRFFPTRKVSPFQIAEFLRHWLPRTAVLVATLNLQRLDTDLMPADKLADAWHHHPVAEVCGEGFRMMYPDVTYSREELGRLLDSESVLLVKEQDILFHTTPKGPIANSKRDFSDIEILRQQKDPRWDELGTIENVYDLSHRSATLYFGDDPWETSLLDPSRRIKIPAAYKPGITVFVRRENAEECKHLDSYPFLQRSC